MPRWILDAYRGVKPLLQEIISSMLKVFRFFLFIRRTEPFGISQDSPVLPTNIVALFIEMVGPLVLKRPRTNSICKRLLRDKRPYLRVS